MAAELLILEGANLFCGLTTGDHSIGTTNHLALAELKLPTIEESYVEYNPGGAPLKIQVDVIFEHLECTFTLAGWTPQVQTLINAWQAGSGGTVYGAQNTFYAYGAIRNRDTGGLSQAMAEFRGRLGTASPAAFRRGDLQHWSYAIKEIMRYKLIIADVDGNRATFPTTLYDYDFLDNRFVVGQT